MSIETRPLERSAPAADAALVSSIVAGEAHAFERLMRQHNRRLFRVARSILRNDADAEDALQEGYIKAHRAIAGFRGEASLSTWLTRIVVNQALEQRRRPERPDSPASADDMPESDADAVPETPEILAMRRELRRLIERAIDGLPEAHRSVFMLRAVEGLSVEETSVSLGISPANTKVRLLRARARLRRVLGEQLGPLLEDVFTFDGERCDRIVKRVCERLSLAAPILPALGSPDRA